MVLQSLSQATDRHLPAIVEALVELLAPKGILARNDPKVRTLEGLEQTVEVLHGEVPEVIEVREGPVTYQVDPRHGQKTGLFLDQRENREATARYARGRLLDCFSYNGGFALYLAGKCDSVLAIDASADAVARITANAARNHLPHVTAREGNVFDELRYFERDGERFDTIVLDPPAFAKNKASVEKALVRLQGHQPARAAPAGARWRARDVQLLVQRRRAAVSPGAGRSGRRRQGTRHDSRKAHAGARSSGVADRAGDVLFEVRDSPEELGRCRHNHEGAKARWREEIGIDDCRLTIADYVRRPEL